MNAILIITAISLMILDAAIAIIIRLIRKGYTEINSNVFIVGVTFKIIVIILILLLSVLVQIIFKYDVVIPLFLIYYLYELKSIDEHVKDLLGKSIIEEFISIFKKLKRFTNRRF